MCVRKSKTDQSDFGHQQWAHSEGGFEHNLTSPSWMEADWSNHLDEWEKRIQTRGFSGPD